jgi:hypothetical protein
MSTRVLRDGLLESEAVLSLPPEGRWLYVSILLSADDYGLFEATPFKLAKRGDVKRDHIASLLGAMTDVDLVRLYQPDKRAARTFGVVTKFGQRMRASRSKYPLPPLSLVADQDDDYVREFKGLAARMSGACRSRVSDSPPEAEAEADKDLSVFVLDPSPPSGTQGLVASAVAAPTRKRTAPPCPTDEIVALWNELCAPPLAVVEVMNTARKTAVATRWREVCASSGFDKAAGIDWFRWLFTERVAASDFLMGRLPAHRGKSWRCNFDWLMGPTNFAKAVDGNYANRKGAP